MGRILDFIFKTNNNSKKQEFSKENLLKTCFEIFNSVGFNPNHIIDIGANHGTWTRETLTYFPDSYYTLIEPQYWLKDSIKDILNESEKIEFIPIGAGKQNTKLKFTLVERDDSCSFLFSDEDASKHGYKQIEVDVQNLNTIVKNSKFPFPELIKIDAEGIDLDVLEGASDLFGRVEVFMVEAGIVNKKFNNSVLNIINFMDGKGYVLFDITDINRPFTNKVLWLAELVFVKKNGIIDSKNWI